MARECEKRQKSEFDLKRLQESTAKDETVEADNEPTQAEATATDDKAPGFEWRSFSNDVLNGDRRHDAYAEKLRRSVEAIQEYNSGLDDSEQFSITGSLLRQIAGVKLGKVKHG